MSVIAVPDFLYRRFGEATMVASRTDFQMRSFSTRQRQVLSWPSAHQWLATCTVPKLAEPWSGEMRAFLSLMDGRANVFQMPVPDYRGPSNGYAGTVGKVRGADQSGFSLETDGWEAGALILPAGSYVTVNDELKLMTADITADGAGEATLTFRQLLRASPADNTDIVIQDPYFVANLVDPEGAAWKCRPGQQQAFHLDIEEAVDLS